MVERAVVVGAITVIFTVTDVVLVVIHREVVEGEAIVCGDEVHRGDRATISGEGVAGACQASGEATDTCRSNARLTCLRDVWKPEVTNTVAVAVVPFVPAVSKVSGLPTAHAHIPGLSNELGCGEDGVGANCLEQRVILVVLSFLVTAQRHSEVETETVHLSFFSPVAQ